MTWKHNESGACFRWCKGCKWNFHEVHAFAGNIELRDVRECRARGRAAYRALGSPAPAPTGTSCRGDEEVRQKAAPTTYEADGKRIKDFCERRRTAPENAAMDI